MPGEYDARINSLTVVDKGTSFTLDTIKAAQDFDVVADLEVGSSLNAVLSRIQIWVSVGNRTQLVQVQTQAYDDQNPGAATSPRTARIVVPFNALTGVNEGDILEATGTFKAGAGALTDYSHAASQPFVFTA